MIAASQLALRIANRVLLENMNFSVTSGEFIAVLGPNGVGKTTFLRAIAGMHDIAGGSLSIEGRAIGSLTISERARTIAFMVSDDAPVDAMPVRAAVASGRYAYHRWWEWRETEKDATVIAQALADVHMSEFSARRFDTLSSGERQRVWLALGLAQEAPLLLLDEPTSHLDVRVAHEILQLLRQLAHSGKTVICVLHDMNEALEFADRLMILSDRSILAFDTPAAIVQNGVLDRAYGIKLEAVRSATGALRVFPSC
ncbi:MAG: ABC transporter ATP-binding protein [Candidatus Eremiobacteraeota bacterium]|nr:ABC transporter ATP-binding protein [Candidatus Eremiobacteraeota bacterium]